jgi:ribokinase
MIIVFGAIYTDMVMRMEKFPDPGETVLTKQSYHYVPGGKGANQALAASRAGQKVLLAGAIGDDQHGVLALTLLQSAGVDLSAVKLSLAPTGCSSIFVNNHGENMICSATGANQDARADQITDKMLEDADALVLQCEAPIEECAKLASRAKIHGLKVILNVAPAINVPDYYLKNIDYLIMNEVEAEFVRAGRNLTSLNSPGSIFSQQKQLVMIVTQGKNGGVQTLNGIISHFSAPKVHAVDTTAAGDTFIGYLAAGITSKESDIETAIEIASKAASICCTRHGSQPSIPFSFELS